jgi:hypothetical protein
LFALLLVVERTVATIKQVSDSILDSASFLDLRRAHKDKLGLQREVRTCQLCWLASALNEYGVLVCIALPGQPLYLCHDSQPLRQLRAFECE